jgi:hypothetical protein
MTVPSRRVPADVPAFEDGDAGPQPRRLPGHREAGKPGANDGNVDIEVERQSRALGYRPGIRPCAGTCENLAHIVSS